MNDDLKKMQELEQAMAAAAESLPPMWRRMYDNCLASGFDATQSMQIVLAYVHGLAGGRLDLPS